MTSEHTNAAEPFSPRPGGAEVAQLLARARFSDVVEFVGSSPRATTWDRVQALDASVRLGKSGVVEIEEMAGILAPVPESEDLRLWLEVLRAEHLLWRADLGAVSLATPLLERLPADATASFRVLVPRARVRRIMGVAAVFAGDRRRSAELCADAAADFARAGWEAERAMTLALHAVLHVGVFMDDFELMGSVAAEARGLLEELDSPLRAEALLGEAFVALAAGDPGRMWQALDRLGVAEAASLPALGSEVLQRFAGLLSSGGREQEVRVLEEALLDLRRRYPQPARMLTVTAAHVLCDLGRTTLARGLGALAEYGAETGLLGTRDRHALQLRLRLLGGDARALDAVRELLEALWAEGLVRDAAMKAARFAIDCRRTGRVEAAGALEGWSRTRRPPDQELTVWEAWWAARATEAVEEAAETAGAVELRLLDTHVSVVRAGRVHRLKGGTARLLVVLVAADGTVGAEALIDRLWPEVDLEAGRNRLNVTLHRLRRAIGVDRQVIVRSGAAVWFAPPPGWSVDTWEFRRLADGGSADRRAALDLYRDHLCIRQLPYDEAVLGERLLLEARLARLLVQLVEDPLADPVVLAERVLRLEVRDPDLVGALAARVSREGHTLLAERLRGTVGWAEGISEDG
jgi:hypothetical protein